MTLTDEVRAAVSEVTDPEYPDVSIVDLGLVETIEVTGTEATVGLIPTFSGCPALGMIAADVREAVEALSDIDACSVSWLPGPVWSTDRMTATARITRRPAARSRHRRKSASK